VAAAMMRGWMPIVWLVLVYGLVLFCGIYLGWGAA
jgi:hypothetical protein